MNRYNRGMLIEYNELIESMRRRAMDLEECTYNDAVLTNNGKSLLRTGRYYVELIIITKSIRYK